MRPTLICPTPARAVDDRHVQDSVPDLTQVFYDFNDEPHFPLQIMTMRCAGCGCALTSGGENSGRWEWLVIEESP